MKSVPVALDGVTIATFSGLAALARCPQKVVQNHRFHFLVAPELGLWGVAAQHLGLLGFPGQERTMVKAFAVRGQGFWLCTQSGQFFSVERSGVRALHRRAWHLGLWASESRDFGVWSSGLGVRGLPVNFCRLLSAACED